MAANGGWQNADDEKRNVKCGSQNAGHKMRITKCGRQNADRKCGWKDVNDYMRMIKYLWEKINLRCFLTVLLSTRNN